MKLRILKGLVSGSGQATFRTTGEGTEMERGLFRTSVHSCIIPWLALESGRANQILTGSPVLKASSSSI